MWNQCFGCRVSETMHRRVQKSLFVPNLHQDQKYPYCVQSEKINCADSLPFLFFCLVALSSDSLGALAVTFMQWEPCRRTRCCYTWSLFIITYAAAWKATRDFLLTVWVSTVLDRAGDPLNHGAGRSGTDCSLIFLWWFNPDKCSVLVGTQCSYQVPSPLTNQWNLLTRFLINLN